MIHTISVGAPVVVGDRVILPLIRDEMACWSTGAVARRDPVALLFSDDGGWFFAPLETGITPDLLNNLTQ